jgi:hypothetical protein
MTLAFSIKFGLITTVLACIYTIYKGGGRNQVQAIGIIGIILTLIMAINSNG